VDSEEDFRHVLMKYAVNKNNQYAIVGEYRSDGAWRTASQSHIIFKQHAYGSDRA